MALVRDWVRAHRSKLTQVATQRIEKALFALYHMCKEDSSPGAIIWAFYGLETLFETKTGESLGILTERATLLLELGQKHLRSLKKGLRGLYDTRSAFVHGGLEVYHPMGNEALEKKVDEVRWRLMEETEFGFSLLLARIQKVIALGKHHAFTSNFDPSRIQMAIDTYPICIPSGFLAECHLVFAEDLVSCPRNKERTFLQP